MKEDKPQKPSNRAFEETYREKLLKSPLSKEDLKTYKKHHRRSAFADFAPFIYASRMYDGATRVRKHAPDYGLDPIAATIAGTTGGAMRATTDGMAYAAIKGALDTRDMRLISHANPSTKKQWVNAIRDMENANSSIFAGREVRRDFKAKKEKVDALRRQAVREGKANLALAKAERKAQKTAMYEDMIMEKAASMMH